MSAELSKRARIVLYAMIGCQLIAWAWFSSQGGKLSDANFLIFTGGMLLGQLAAGIETMKLRAWGTLVVQVWFFGFTAYGGVVRWLGM